MFSDIFSGRASEGLRLRLIKVFMVMPIRSYYRYFPITTGKERLWRRTVRRMWNYEQVVRTTTTDGVKMYVNARDIIGKYIYYFGFWEPCLSGWLSKRLSLGDTFIDVGANVGYYSLLASKLVGSRGHVLAIEPLPTSFAILTENVRLNSQTNIRCSNLAAWNKDEKLTIFGKQDKAYPSGVSSVMPAWAEWWQLEGDSEVLARPLDVIASTAELQESRIIKIDVEGAEWQVIQGLLGVLPNCRADLEIVIELSLPALQLQGLNYNDVLRVFDEAGFHAYLLTGVPGLKCASG